MSSLRDIPLALGRHGYYNALGNILCRILKGVNRAAKISSLHAGTAINRDTEKSSNPLQKAIAKMQGGVYLKGNGTA